jgi:hypothetical protein
MAYSTLIFLFTFTQEEILSFPLPKFTRF